MTPPTTVENQATCGAVAANVLTCKFAKALAAKTSYGLAMPGTGAAVGIWAPVTMKTRMND